METLAVLSLAAQTAQNRVGRSSDFRAVRRHSLLAATVQIAFAKRIARQWQLENDVRYRSVTAAGPSRVYTGVPCLLAEKSNAFSQPPTHYRAM
jgi:hypothetical protein